MLKKIAAAAALAIVASTAAAQNAAPAFYIGADIGSTDLDGYEDRETGYGLFAGYQLNETFAIEANYRMRADEDGYEADQVGLSAIAAMPLTDAFSLYGRLGYNRVELTGSSVIDRKESGVLYGVGLGYAFSPTVTARVEVQKPHSDVTNLSAGVAFKF